MTTIQTTGPISDTLELVNASGDKLTLSFSFAPSVSIIKRFREFQVSLVEAKRRQTDEATEVVGNVVIGLFESIFGRENTEKITDFYAGSYEYMALDLVPYLADTVVPKCRQVAERAKRTAKSRWRK